MEHAASLTSAADPALVRDASARLQARSRATGVLVFAAFAGLWAAAGVFLSGASPWSWLPVALLVLAFGARAVGVLRANPAPAEPLPAAVAERRRRGGRIFLWTNVAEGVGILVAVNVVANLGHPQWQIPAVMAIVGLHFLPLARAFAFPPHLVTGVAMTAWALAYPGLCAAGATAAAGPFGAAAILFASAAWALRAALPRR